MYNGGIVMPFINTKVSVELTPEKEGALKQLFARAMAEFGKPEAYLMLCFEDNARLWFAGSNSSPAAFIDVSILHTASRNAYEKLTEALCDAVSGELGIPKSRIYVKYEETENWGHDGYMF